MVAWMGCVDESLLLKEGPYSLLMKHIADPVHNNIMSPSIEGQSTGGLHTPSATPSAAIRSLRIHKHVYGNPWVEGPSSLPNARKAASIDCSRPVKSDFASCPTSSRGTDDSFGMENSILLSILELSPSVAS
eukprot:scaffold1402_cov403-Prasinococcus_capsulatus_cf.AAC.17